MTGAREEAFSDRRNRSSSRSSQGRVEKRIEATLAEAEPSSHARSRKASHTLGLFRENTVSHGINRGQDKSRTASDNAVDTSTRASRVLSDKVTRDGRGGRPILDTTRTNEAHESAQPLQPNLEPHGKLIEQEAASSYPQQSSRPPSQNGENLPSKSYSGTDVTANASKGSLTKRTEKQSDASKAKIPLRLLEEIRNYHNLASPFHEKFRFTQSKGTTSGLEKAEDTSCNYDVSWGNQGYINKESSIKANAEPENEDEEAEHISSALYYPHEAPSPDALEDVSINDARKAKDSQIKTDPALPGPAMSIGDETEVPSEDVDIALQVNNKNRYLHGDLQKARPPSELERRPVPESEFSSASESDYESFEETPRPSMYQDSSLTDDAEATPRASPNSRKPYLLSRTRKTRRAPRAPLGAVELKPYNHQVGGHTTVFRFSKRAVCKQLSNRENEFYEVVEREHPELLKFLPRYDPPETKLLMEQAEL